MSAYTPPPAETFRSSMVAGQQVIACFNNGEPKRGVVSRTMETRDSAVMVQFEPCGAHYGCYLASLSGNRSGWTEQEYRIARESTDTLEHAGAVERERRERYPDAQFSMFDEDNPRCQR